MARLIGDHRKATGAKKTKQKKQPTYCNQRIASVDVQHIQCCCMHIVRYKVASECSVVLLHFKEASLIWSGIPLHRGEFPGWLKQSHACFILYCCVFYCKDVCYYNEKLVISNQCVCQLCYGIHSSEQEVSVLWICFPCKENGSAVALVHSAQTDNCVSMVLLKWLRALRNACLRAGAVPQECFCFFFLLRCKSASEGKNALRRKLHR